MKFFRLWLGFLLSLPLTVPAASIYVATNGSGSLATNWISAFTNLHHAFSAAVPGDSIYIAQGTYSVTTEVNWSTHNLTVLGGYAGTNSSGPGPFDTTLWTSVFQRTGGVSRIFQIHDATNATLGRLIIQGGIGNFVGGGVGVTNCGNIHIFDCTIQNNMAMNGNVVRGGGLAIENSTGLISNCVIKSNIAKNSDAWDGTMSALGAGLYVSGGSILFRDCVIGDNKAQDGGLSPTAYADGCGVWADGAHEFRNCLISGNYHYNSIVPTGGTRGGGVWAQNGVTLVNCTVIRNQTEGIRRNAGTVTVRDGILWENGDDVFGAPILDHSCIQDGDSNGVSGCTNADPQFIRGIYLATTSPLINAGSTTASAAGLDARTTQTNGTPDSGTVDIGYHLAGAPTFSSGTIYVSPTGSDTADGTSAGTAFRTVTRALSIAGGGETIRLAAGTYNRAGGETFPLSILAYDLTLEGNASTSTLIDAIGVTDSSVLDVRSLNGTLRFRNLAILNGLSLHMGGGAFLFNCAVEFDRCLIAGNRTGNGDNWGKARGAGLYAVGCDLTVIDSLIRNNYYSSTPFYGYGGAFFLSGGNIRMVRSLIVSNSVSGGYESTAEGGGIYINAGNLLIENCLLASNSGTYGSALRVAGGSVVVSNATVVQNIGQGVNFGGGTLTLLNSILWENNSADIVGTPNAIQSTIQNGYNKGVNGCSDDDPLFVDHRYYHLLSPYGQYEGGYFTNGSWGTGAALSPAIDACNPAVIPTYEPAPNGAIVNRGAYGNTDVASKSHPLSITNRAASSIGLTQATLNGELLHVGNANVHVWIYWGLTDGQDVAANWSATSYIGVLTAPASFSTNLTGLSSGQTYYYTCFASNSAGTTLWGVPSSNFIPILSAPVVVNRGADNELSTSVTLKGEVTSTGGDNPHLYVGWGSWEGSTNLGSWKNIVDLGIQSGAFSSIVSVVSGSNYFYSCFATNSAGGVWASPILPFGSAVIRYVNPAATGGNTGYNWSNAYPSLITALAECRNDRTNVLYLSQGVHPSALPFQLTNSHVFIRGGYEGLTGTPGTQDPAQWPTILTNNSNAQRVWTLTGVSNILIDSVILTGGRPVADAAGLYVSTATGLTVRNCTFKGNRTGLASSGGGLYVINSTNVVLEGCTWSNNQAAVYGGGAYLQSSAVLVSNCLFRGNRISGAAGAYYGIALLANGGSTLIRNCILESNGFVAGMDARGTFASLAGTHVLKNCLIRYNDATYGDGAWINAGTVTFDNCTLFRNRGQGIYQAGGVALVTNSILWANGDDIVGTVTKTFSTIQDGDGVGSNGCLSTHPQFEYLYGLYLSSTSPCVNAGGISAAAAGLAGYTTQIDGSPDNGPVDQGYHYPTGADLIRGTFADLYVTTNGNDLVNTGTNAASPFRSVTKALSVAVGGNRIHIAPGTYSTNANEIFPLTLANMPGVAFIGTNRNSTLINAAGPYKRMFALDNTCDVRIEGLTLTGARNNTPELSAYGGAIHASFVEDLLIRDCLFTNNWADGDHWGNGYGGALYLLQSTCETRDCLFFNNKATGAGGGGGAVYSENSQWMLRRCVANSNTVYREHPPGLTFYGAGFFISGGTVGLTNCLIAGNDSGESADGLYVAAGSVNLQNFTIADNAGFGAWRGGGTVTLRDGILWSNGDDLYNFQTNAEGVVPGVTFCAIGNGDNAGTNGCVTVDPLFIDRTFYHLKSRSAHYTNGFFSGGGWGYTTNTSPLIDQGDPTSDYSEEPMPHGHRVNLGAYGNSPVTSYIIRDTGALWIVN